MFSRPNGTAVCCCMHLSRHARVFMLPFSPAEQVLKVRVLSVDAPRRRLSLGLATGAAPEKKPAAVANSAHWSGSFRCFQV